VETLFKAVDKKMDTGKEERRVFGELAEHLWNGSLTEPPGEARSHPRVSKARLEAMLSKVKQVRERYQALCKQ